MAIQEDGPGAREERKETRDRLSLGLASLGAVLAIISYVTSCSTSKSQDQFQRDVEERASAPVLAAGVAKDRADTVDVRTTIGTVSKKAQLPAIPGQPDNARLIVPVWNIGLGVGVVRSVRAFPSCRKAREAINKAPLKQADRVGYYNVPAGGSEQLVYPMAKSDFLRVQRTNELTVMVRYTDPLIRRDRWTCMEWLRRKASNPWQLANQNYHDRVVALGAS
jgi:hypothetical protein